MTVSTAHGALGHRLVTILGHLKDLKDCPKRLIFVIPPDIFPQFPLQNYLTKKGSVMKKQPKAFKDVQQFALKISLS